MSLRGWTPPPFTGHPGWCRVVEAHSREACSRMTTAETLPIPLGTLVEIGDLDPAFYPTGKLRGWVVGYRADRFLDVQFPGDEEVSQYEPDELRIVRLPS